MDGLKKTVAVFAIIMLVIAFAAPAMAQMYGGRMAQPQAGGYQRGGQQAMPPQGGQGNIPQSNKDLMATMEDRSDISIFTAAVKTAGYDRMLSQSQQNPYMVFAPSDQALQKDLGANGVNALYTDPNAVKNLVESCIVSNVNEPQQGSKTLTMTTLGGTQLIATKSDTGITVNGVRIIDAVMATNGLLTVTDGVVGMYGVR